MTFLAQPALKCKHIHATTIISNWDTCDGNKYHSIWVWITEKKQLFSTTSPYRKLPQLAHIFQLS